VPRVRYLERGTLFYAAERVLPNLMAVSLRGYMPSPNVMMNAGRE